MDENVIVIVFSEESRAYEALARLKEFAADGQIDLHDGAVVERGQDGMLHLRDDAGNEDDGLATLTGGTIGLLIGSLAGPLGVLLGGALGLLAGAIIDAEDDDETDSVLERISRSIGVGETAVLADLDESGPVAVDAAMAALDGRVTRYARMGRRGRDRPCRGGRAQGQRQGPQGATPATSRGDRREGAGEAPRAARAAPATRTSLKRLSDRALRGRIIAALADSPHVDVAEIALECHDDGDVVLRGSVRNLLQRAEAVRTTRHVPGVRAVDDQLRTRPEGAAHRVDAETEAAILDALILDDTAPVGGIDVDVEGGRVTLCGAVDSASQREAAERIALRVPGVAEVRNRLEVW